MGKIETRIQADLLRKGFFVGQGKRVANVARRMQANGKLEGHRVQVEAFNANASKSQWNSPRLVASYETFVGA